MLTLARGSATLLALLAAGPALAQGKPLPPPATDAMPPVELTISLKDGKPVCAPAELKLPADTNVALNIVSSADAPVTITAPGQFENGLVLHADGDLVHVASEKGYTVKQNGKGTLRLRTMKAGQEEYACTSTRNADAPFKGKLVLSPPAN
ncbi:cupredoxin domain-containing protein [Methylobacterium sp. NMS14P]|uniref:anaerobic typically selenocysteine-containing protein n=1 Tax=Methylobacterium sp. NMS14P TaxID=2894310 RepID=UPI002359F1B5|nr:anaerobic typically selenocysteine-containing protein [Methylobacterium sp. NMS14P]WCS26026.1 cupredoxin domain-containing protein [Methylobacterium sp. NMS14P]